MDLKISKSSVHRAIQESGCKKKKLQNKPILNQTHKSKRLDFARKSLIQSMNWREVIFSDEKRWNLDGPDGNESFFGLMKDDQSQNYYRYR